MRAAIFAGFGAAFWMSLVAAKPPPPLVETGRLESGAQWQAQIPDNWNGTLLLWSRGYAPSAGKADAAPAPVAKLLLDQGYALAGSNYGAGGWALEEAVPAQLGTVAAFTAAHGKPKRVIAWGYSMGGLVTTALAERNGAGIDGAAAFCPSIGGAVGMMNMALDGAYAFRTLVAPEAGLRLTHVDDDRANTKRAMDALAKAVTTPQGRARVALAGVLAGIPGWTSHDNLEPSADDYDAQASEIAKTFVMGTFLPRTDQEQRAGGAFSWNTGIEYRRQLANSGRQVMVRALYRKAGLSLDADLARLDAGTRVVADPGATAYMMRHYTPNARPVVPIVAVQMIGDGLTSPALTRGYAEAAGRRARALYVHGAGHCTFEPDTVVAAIHYLEHRIDKGSWGDRPVAFIAHTPQPMMRSCVRGGKCR